MMLERGVAGLVLSVALLITACTDGEGPLPQSFAPDQISLRESGELKELLDEKLVFVDASGTEWIAPKGTLTDGATIPRLALPITDGRWDVTFLKAAVVHDAYCQVENEARTPAQYRKRTWQAVHRMFYEACLAGGTSPLLAKIMFAGVWLGGPRWGDAEHALDNLSSDTLTRGFVGSKQWIEANDPSLDDLVVHLETREPVLRELAAYETGIEAALGRGDVPTASALLRDQEVLLDRESAASPNDLMLLEFKGYLHTNKAVLYQRTNANDQASNELIQAEQAFQAVQEVEPQIPDVLTGLGHVAVLRGDLASGERLVRDALEIAPASEEALRDLRHIEALRERRIQE